MNKRIGVALLSVAALALVAGCGGSGGDKGSSSPGGGAATGTTTGTGSGAGAMQGRGPITYAQGKDTSGKLHIILDKWNADHPNEKVTLQELPESADDQRNAMVQDFQAHSGKFDVDAMDVVWTAEFGARGWLEPLTNAGLDTASLLPAAIATATYQNTLYAAPYQTNGQLLFYRTDLVKAPPKTWDELVKDCSIAKSNNMGCLGAQYAQYEGLTVNYSEAVASAGGRVVDDQGKVTCDSDAAKTGLKFLVDNFADGNIPKEAVTYKEEESRRAFQTGKLLFLQNWPYVWQLSQAPGKDSVVQGKVGTTVIPGLTGAGASTIGGYNLGLNKDSKNKATAVDFMKFMESEFAQRSVLVDQSNAPVLSSLYDDTGLQAQVPFLASLKQSLSTAVPRPQVVSYAATSTAISETVYKILQDASNGKTVDIDKSAADIKKAIEGAMQGS